MWDFMASFFALCIFSEPRAARFRPVHLKFALSPHHESMVYTQSVAAEIRHVEKDEEERR